MPLPDAWRGLIVITADFETYYDKEYSLKKMTPEEYIRDKRFEILGVSVQLRGNNPIYLTGTEDWLKQQLSQLPWGQAIYNNHNVSGFDGLILYEKLGIRPYAYADTLAMGRALIGAGANKRGGLSLAALAKRYGLAEKLEDVLEQVAGMRREEIPADLMKLLGEYAKRDSHIAYGLFLRMSEEMPAEEMEQIDLLARMFSVPRIRVDHKLAALLGETEAWEKDRLIARSGLTKKQLGSGPQLAQAFLDRGVEPGMKTSPTTGKETYAFAKDDEWMESMLGHENDELRAIAEARVAVKSTIGASRLARLEGIGERGLLPAPIVYGRAVTHRVGGSGKINLQNMSRPKSAGDAVVGQVVYTPSGYGVCVAVNSTTDQIAVVPMGHVDMVRKFVSEGAELIKCVMGLSPTVFNAWECHVAGVRDVIMAQEGYTFAVADSSNIELRVAHTLAGQEDTVQALRNKEDLYCSFASTLYGFEVTKKNKPERLHGKVGMLQLQYQSGWSSFQKAARVMGGLRLMETECRSTVDLYRTSYYKLPMFWRRCLEAIGWMYAGTVAYIDDFGLLKTGKNHIELPGGLKLIYHGLRQEPDEQFGKQWVYNDKETGAMKRLYGGSLFENICQALARLVVFGQMIQIDREFGGYDRPNEGVVLTVHDEVVTHIRKELAQSCLDYSLLVMSKAPEWWPELPVDAEGDVADRYAVAK